MRITLYSMYFNPKISRRLGRKIPLEIAKRYSDQKLEEILKSLKLAYEAKDGRYPRVPYENSKIFTLEANLKKGTILKMIERKL